MTAEGEAILASYDNWAISALRAHRLVWSGWGPAQRLDDIQHLFDGNGLRRVNGIDPKRLRLFFLSILWRAAASSRPEFGEVLIPDLLRLGNLLIEGDPGDLDFYPTTLTQMSTLGLQHNHTPLAMTKVTPSIGDLPERTIPFFRFYFDGLVAHMHRQSKDPAPGQTEDLGPLVVGARDEIVLHTVTFETSSQLENLRKVRENSIGE